MPVKEGADLSVVNSSPRDSPWKSYRLEGILPGTYDLYAVFRPDDVAFYGRTRIEVGVDDQDNVNLAIRPGVSVSGRVTVGQANASDAVTDAITTMELWLDPMHVVMMTPLLSPTIEPDGSFHIVGIPLIVNTSSGIMNTDSGHREHSPERSDGLASQFIPSESRFSLF